MKLSQSSSLYYPPSNKAGFSLIEVVLAIGIFLVTVLALVGLLGPTLQSVDEVEKTDEISSVVNTINAFLQSSPDIAPTVGQSKFNEIYNAVGTDGYATLLIFRQYQPDDEILLKIGFVGETSATVTSADVTNGSQVLAAGTVYRAVLTPSSVIPEDHISDRGVDEYPRYTLTKAIDTYPEGYFAMEVRIFDEEPSLTYDVNLLPSGEAATPENLKGFEPVFTYNTAIVR
jgi:Tfp pilus assembly protein PilV